MKIIVSSMKQDSPLSSQAVTEPDWTRVKGHVTNVDLYCLILLSLKTQFESILIL